MATCSDQGTPRNGVAGAYGWYTRSGETVMRIRHNITSKKKPSEGQREIQMGFANEVLLWNLFGEKLEMAFEKSLRKPGETPFNCFVRVNERRFNIYLTKEMVMNRSVIIPPVQISLGKMPNPIQYEKQGDSVVTTIALGNLTIDATTTVAQFTAAVLENNVEKLCKDYYIGFFKGHQYIDINTHLPMGEFTSGRLKLDGTDGAGRDIRSMSLWSVTGRDGFHSVDGHLATPYSQNDLYAWICLEKTLDNEYRCTTQHLYGGDTNLMELYGTREAFLAACESYGGFSTNYLAPFENSVNYRADELPEDGDDDDDSGNEGGDDSGDNPGTNNPGNNPGEGGGGDGDGDMGRNTSTPTL